MVWTCGLNEQRKARTVPNGVSLSEVPVPAKERFMLRHWPLKEVAYAAAFLALLFVLYVGAYYSLVVRIEFPDWIIFTRGGTECCVDYRVGGETSEQIFSLWHKVDRKLR